MQCNAMQCYVVLCYVMLFYVSVYVCKRVECAHLRSKYKKWVCMNYPHIPYHFICDHGCWSWLITTFPIKMAIGPSQLPRWRFGPAGACDPTARQLRGGSSRCGGRGDLPLRPESDRLIARSTWRFPEMGVPPNHPNSNGTFHETNHPFGGTPL